MIKNYFERAMFICSKQVRRVPCAKCFNFEKCKREGAPASMLARFLAWLDMDALPYVENEIMRNSSKVVKLEAYAPNDHEIEQGAYAVVRAYSLNRAILFRVFLDGDENLQDVKTLVFNAYVRSTRKLHND